MSLAFPSCGPGRTRVLSSLDSACGEAGPIDPQLRRPTTQPTSNSPAAQRADPLIKVSVRSNESLEAALRRFKRQCNYSGIFRLAKANTWHEKRSDRRRRERRERLRTVQKATRKNDPNRRRRRRPGGAPKKR